MPIYNSNCCFNVSERSRSKIKVSWFLGSSCNLECSHCSVKALHESTEQIPMEPDEQTKILRTLTDLISKYEVSDIGIVISGGEPLIYASCLEVAKNAKDLGLPVSIATNGLRLEAMVEDLLKVGVNKCIVSLDSHKESIHNELRKNPKAHKMAISGIIEAQKNGLKVATCVYVHDNNIEDLCPTIGFTVGLGVKQISLSFPMALGREVLKESNIATKVITNHGWTDRIIREAQLRIERDYPEAEVILSRPYCSKQRIRKLNGGKRIEKKKCPFSGRQVISVSDYQIRPCFYDSIDTRKT